MRKRWKNIMLSTFLIVSIVGVFCITGYAIGAQDNMFGDRVFVSDVKSQLAPGAYEHRVTTNNTSGTDQNIDFLTEVDLAGTDTIKIMSCYAGYSTIQNGNVAWQMMTLPEQAQKAQDFFDSHQKKYPNYKVVGALVGDTYNMGTGQPSHVLVMDGVTYQNADGSYYFGVDKSGKPLITDNMDTSNLESAVGGMGLIVQNGKNVASAGNAYVDGSFSRAAVGITAEGKVLTFCTYGNSYPISCGYTWGEVADYLIAQGCVDALMLDGSGSAEWCARYEGTDSVQSVSHPSDGSSRAVGSCLLIVSTAAPDGVFDRASISPDAAVFTPGSSVQFEAVGADNAGNSVTIPADAQWKLSDTSYGTIDQNGMFASNEKQGDVTVSLEYNDKVCGTSTITIAAPDSITFSKPNEDVGRGKSSNLGLQVRYQNRDVNLKDGDIRWTLSNNDENSDVQIGTISFNDGKYIFTGNTTTTCSGVINAESKYDKSVYGSIQVKVGTDPVKAMNFEIPESGESLQSYYGLDDNNYVIGRKNNGTIESPTNGLLSRLYYGRGGQETARIVSVSDGYPVHSGSNALQVNYDFSQCANGTTEGANVGLTEKLDIPGHPTAIGLWVWVPENTPNLWLRVRLAIYNPNGDLNTTTQFDFGPQINETFPKDGTYGGLTICEEGTWYFCTADLSKYDGCTFSIPAGEAIRLMRTDGASILSYGEKNITQSHGKYLKDGTEVPTKNLKGSVYFDDLMFIYGSVNEDTDAPRVKEALVQSFGADAQTELSDGMTVGSNGNSFSFYMEDVIGDSGIEPIGLDYENCYLYVDGDLMNGKDGTVVDTGSSSIRTDVTLSNGNHSIRLVVSDKNGNRSSKTYNFTVAGNERKYPTYMLKSNVDFAPLGGKVPLTIHTTDATGLQEFVTTIQVDNRYRNGGFHITAADGFSYEEGSAKYDEVNNTVTFKVTSSGSKTGECDLATIEFDIDRNLASGSYFAYTITAGIEKKTQIGTEGDNFHGGFTLPQTRLKVEAPYTISSDLLYQNMTKPGYIYVNDNEGNPAAGIGIYKQDGTQLGTTDETGKWQVTSELLKNVQQLIVYASCENGISFNETISVFGTNAEESPVIFTTGKDGATGKKLSWLSNVQESVSFRYAESEEELEKAQVISVKTETVKFGGSSFANAVTAQINSVELKNLTLGRTYYYQYRYGDGKWKTAGSFTAKETGSTTDFFVLGDVQANDTSNINAIIGNLTKDEYAFGIQTGDLVDQAYNYEQWKDALTLMSGLGDQDMLYALGNHENNMGDDGSIAQKVYQMPNKKYYSVEYGNVYVANISYNSLSGYREALEWLVQDANSSEAKWKILAMHQPTYYTNSTATDNLGMNELMPSYLQKAGINVVFSGHDHSYARTAALIDGKRSASYDEQQATCNRGDGIVYYICGSSGEKSYPIDSTLPFDYKTSADFNAIYLTVKAAKDTLTVNTYDLVNAETGEANCIDTFTMYASACVTGGHTFSENSSYDLSAKTLTCSNCNEAVAASESDYTGIANAGEKQVYLFNGKLKTGWITIGEEVVHAGDEGILHQTLSFTTETCTENGTRMAYCEECDITKSYGTNVKYHNHSYDSNYKCQNSYYDEKHELHECGWTGVNINDLETSLAYKYGYYDGNARKPKVTVKDVNGKTLINQSTYGDYVAYYSDNTDVGVATIRLVAYNSYYGEKVLHFEVRPANIKTIQTDNITENSVKLTWESSLGAEKYAIYQDFGSSWKKIADTTEDFYEVKGLSKGSTYQFRIRPYAVVENAKQRLDGSFDSIFWSTQNSDAVTVKTKNSSSGGNGGGAVIPPAADDDIKTTTDSTTSETTTKTTVKDTKTETVKNEQGEEISKVTATVSEKVAEKLVDAAVSNKSDTVEITVKSNDVNKAAQTEVEIPKKALESIAKDTNADLVIKTDSGQVVLDNRTLETIAAEAEGDTVRLVVNENTQLKETQKPALDVIGDNGKLFDLKAVIGDKILHDFRGGKAHVTLPMPEKLKGKDIVIIYINDKGICEILNHTMETVGAEKYIKFTTSHFSNFAVVEKADAEKIIDKQNADKINTLVKEVKLKAATSKTSKKNVRIKVSVRNNNSLIKEAKAMGYTVKYKFYKSAKKASKYKAFKTRDTNTYINTAGKKGTRYYYKAKVLVYDGKTLIAQTELKQCSYGARCWSK